VTFEAKPFSSLIVPTGKNNVTENQEIFAIVTGASTGIGYELAHIGRYEDWSVEARRSV
jgi:hypothetical protein